MQVLPTLGPIYLNARADECEAVVNDHGVRIVRYRGGMYTVIGYYLASHAGERVLCYVLRAPCAIDRPLRRANNSAPYAAPSNT